MRTQLHLVAFLAICVPCSAQRTSVEQLLTQSEPPIQERIGKILDALNQSRVDPPSNIAALREAFALTESGVDSFEIVKQVAIFAASPATREGRPFEARTVLELLNLPPKIIIRVLAPYIDAENPQLRSFVRNWFQSHDSCGSGAFETVNFGDYKDYVQVMLNIHQEVPTAFVEYLYERSPGQALIVFYNANPERRAETIERIREAQEKLEADRRQNLEANEQQVDDIDQDEARRQREEKRKQEKEREWVSEQRKEILLAEHIVSDAIWLKQKKFEVEFLKAVPAAKSQLINLADRDQWWARLYVAEIMRRHPEFRHPPAAQRLSTDANPLVKKAADWAK
ncbi:MAG: hypothetical protein WD851_17490 [Pirellulales bacterium]